MKKLIIIAMLLIGSIAQASEFKCYGGLSIKECTQKLNELNKEFDIYSYKIVPDYLQQKVTSFVGSSYNLIAEVGKKEKESKSI